MATEGAPALTDEDGFSLIETVVAIAILGLIFAMTAGMLTSMMSFTLFARQNQQSIDVISQSIEELRSRGYDAVAMVPGDLGGDPAVGPAPDYLFDPDGAGPLPAEKAAVSATGTVNPHLSQVVRNATVYSIARYVTNPGDSTGAYKRITVRATWTRAGQSHTRQASTFITNTRRGLVLPRFTFGTAAVKTVNQGTTLVLAGTVTNRGVRDRFDLTAVASGRSWAFQWYVDVNGNGQKDAEDTTALTDTDGNGVVDTGIVETDQQRAFLAVYAIPATEPIGTVSVTRTARSVAQPSAPSASMSLTDTITVTVQPCSGCTLKTYYLHSTPPGDTRATANLPMDGVPGSQSPLPNFDLDFDARPGRLVKKGASGPADTKLANYANWRFDAPNDMSFRGDVVATLWGVGKERAQDKRIQVVVYVRSESSTGSGYVEQGSATIDLIGASDFTRLEARVPVDFSVRQFKRVEVKVVVANSSGDDLLLAWDTAAHPANVVLPVTVGA